MGQNFDLPRPKCFLILKKNNKQNFSIFLNLKKKIIKNTSNIPLIGNRFLQKMTLVIWQVVVWESKRFKTNSLGWLSLPLRGRLIKIKKLLQEAQGGARIKVFWFLIGSNEIYKYKGQR